MNLIKRCPSCTLVNGEGESFCIQCETDLSGVKTELTSPLRSTPEDAATRREVRICPKCATPSEVIAFLCGTDGCGTSLDKVIPTQISTIQERPPEVLPKVDSLVQPLGQKRLWLLISDRQFECKNGDILGRAGTVAAHFFREIDTISSQHASLAFKDGKWTLINLPLLPGRSAKNLTALDGRDVAIGTSVPLIGEHVLRLSKRCEVRLIVSRE